MSASIKLNGVLVPKAQKEDRYFITHDVTEPQNHFAWKEPPEIT